MRYVMWAIIMVHFMLLGSMDISYAYQGKKDAAQLRTSGTNKLEIESEFLSPCNEKRQIDTASLNILFGRENSDNHLSFYSGATITRAWGDLTHNKVNSDTSAFGIGPTFLMRYEPLQWEKISLSLDSSGSLIFYNQEFPAGGDNYNFMWRIGPKITYQIDDNRSLSIGYKLMHVSNGQPSHNPSYNATGFSLSVKVSL